MIIEMVLWMLCIVIVVALFFLLRVREDSDVESENVSSSKLPLHKVEDDLQKNKMQGDVELSQQDYGRKIDSLVEVFSLYHIQATWNALRSAHGFFWQILETCYFSYIFDPVNTDYPRKINELIDSAKPLTGLPQPDNATFPDYSQTYIQSLDSDESRLFTFCSKIYPWEQSAELLKDNSLVTTRINEKAFVDFHAARGDLADFFDQTGKMIFSDASVTINKFSQTFRKFSQTLNVLGYLEVALYQRTGTRTTTIGKPYLLHLARHVSLRMEEE